MMSKCFEVESQIIMGICEYCSYKDTDKCKPKCCYVIYVDENDLTKTMEKLIYDIGDEADYEEKERLMLLVRLINLKWKANLEYIF
jgi:hypothetical protein